MKALVVGGAGYIGSHFTLDLIRAGHEVAVIDDLSTGTRDFVHPDAAFHQCDITDTPKLKQVFAAEPNLDVVFHFAAKLIVPESLTQPLSYYHTNIEGVRSLLSCMIDAGVSNLVFSSTAAVYGNPDTNKPLTEDAPTAPINPYGASKLAAEQLITWAATAHGLNTAILRYFNAAGADASLTIGLEKPHQTHLIPLATRAALGLEGPVEIYGDDWPTPDGSCIRDYIHVSDLSNAHLLAANYLLSEQDPLLLNLGTTHGSSVKEVLAAVDALLPVPYRIGARRPGDPAVLIADATRAQNILGWHAQRTLADIVSSDLAYRQTQMDTTSPSLDNQP